MGLSTIGGQPSLLLGEAVRRVPFVYVLNRHNSCACFLKLLSLSICTNVFALIFLIQYSQLDFFYA
jgi:hypothetical protein